MKAAMMDRGLHDEGDWVDRNLWMGEPKKKKEKRDMYTKMWFHEPT